MVEGLCVWCAYRQIAIDALHAHSSTCCFDAGLLSSLQSNTSGATKSAQKNQTRQVQCTKCMRREHGYSHWLACGPLSPRLRYQHPLTTQSANRLRRYTDEETPRERERCKEDKLLGCYKHAMGWERVCFLVPQLPTT